MTYILVTVLSLFIGTIAGTWWLQPDIKELNNKIKKLEAENARYRKHILRNFNIRMTRNGVEVNLDE
jgi:hypothetical protein